MNKQIHRCVAASLLIAFLSVSGCDGGKSESDEQAPRPVAVIDLRQIDPSESLRISGSANSWQDEDIAFEVAGRITSIVQADTPLEGRWLEGGFEGDVLAKLDQKWWGKAAKLAINTFIAEPWYFRAVEPVEVEVTIDGNTFIVKGRAFNEIIFTE